MSTLDELLGSDPADPRERLASELAREDENLLRSLVDERVRRGITQRQLADKIGVSQPTIAEFERSGNDPRMSTVRRYALAVNVCVHHWVASPKYQDTSELALKKVAIVERETSISDTEMITLARSQFRSMARR